MHNLDIDFVRGQFPALSGEFTFFDNAGGTQVTRQVCNRITDYLLCTNVQLGASYDVSVESGKRVDEAQKLWSEAINAKHAEEVVFGSSTTALIQNIARSMSLTLKPGDEVIVTNSDHEANIGPWLNLKNNGIVVKIWKINPKNLNLDISDLEKLITKKTKLVAFTHVSNILGTINPIEQITKFVHSKGAKVFVDGVAYAPHRLIDVRKWDVDYYVFSLYKVYGPHYSLLYGKKELLAKLPGINHFFIGDDDIPYKLQPGNVNYELSYGCVGILDYFDDIFNGNNSSETLPLHKRLEVVFKDIAQYEQELAEPLITYLKSKKGVTIIGEESSSKNVRVPTISFIVHDKKSSQIPLLVDPHNIGIRWGDFYARRLINDLGLNEKDGIIRVSMVHYNTIEEVLKLIKVLDEVIRVNSQH
jgi:cysteine desulfurase family protein (TIGR01976 family)